MSQSKTIEFYFDFGSPATFLAYTQIEAIAERTGAELVWKPMLLGGVFKATGNASPVLIPAKGRWMMGDIMRWAERYGTHIRYPEGFPLNTLALMRGVIFRITPVSLYSIVLITALVLPTRLVADPVEIGT